MFFFRLFIFVYVCVCVVFCFVFLFVRDSECDAIVNFLFGRKRRSLFFFLPGGGRARPNEIVARLRDYTIRGHFYGHDLHIAFLFRAPVAHSQKDKTKQKKKKNRKCLPVPKRPHTQETQRHFRHLERAALHGHGTTHFSSPLPAAAAAAAAARRQNCLFPEREKKKVSFSLSLSSAHVGSSTTHI